MKRQRDGLAFDLDPVSRERIVEAGGRPSPAQVFIGLDTLHDFEELHGPFWNQLALILTGLRSGQLKELGYKIVDVETGNPVGTD
jgi:hypothetical protein